MPHEHLFCQNEDRAVRLFRLVSLAWLLVISIVTVRTMLMPWKNNCVILYREAGLAWFHGDDLYQRLNDTCRYSPIMHVVLVPLGAVSLSVASILWRWGSVILLLAGLFWWFRSQQNPTLGLRDRAFVFGAMLPLSIGCLNNGQANTPMLAGMLIGMAAALQGRWWIASLGMTLAVFLKVYPLAMVLLMMLVLPRAFAWRVGLLIAGGCIVPFFCQDPGYVARQYGLWLANLAHDDRSYWEISAGYRDLWMLIRLAHLPVPRNLYIVVQLTTAAGLALACLWMRQRFDRETTLRYTFWLGCSWMMLCGPTTESSTYLLMSLPIAWSLREVMLGRTAPWQSWCLGLAGTGLMIPLLAAMFPWGPRVGGLGFQPAATLLFVVAMIMELRAKESQDRAVVTSASIAEPVRLARNAA